MLVGRVFIFSQCVLILHSKTIDFPVRISIITMEPHKRMNQQGTTHGAMFADDPASAVTAAPRRHSRHRRLAEGATRSRVREVRLFSIAEYRSSSASALLPMHPSQASSSEPGRAKDIRQLGKLQYVLFFHHSSASPVNSTTSPISQ